MAREILLQISYAKILSTNETQSEGNAFQVFFPKVNLFCSCLKTEILFQTICKSSFQIRNQILAQGVLFLTFQAPQKPQAYIKQKYNPNWVCNQHLQVLLLRSPWNTKCALRTSRSYHSPHSTEEVPVGYCDLSWKAFQRRQARMMRSRSSEWNTGCNHSSQRKLKSAQRGWEGGLYFRQRLYQLSVSILK